MRVRPWCAVVSPALLLLLSACSRPEAGLVFDQPVVQKKVAEGEQEIEATFSFVNQASHPIQIEGTETSCGCLLAEPDKAVYQPGEKGIVHAAFDIRGKFGEIEHWINVHTNDPGQPRIRLAIQADIPRLVNFTPKVATWAIGSAPEPKRVRFEVLREKPIHILGMELLRKGVEVSLHPIEPGRIYEIEITPQSTAEPMLGSVSLETDCEIPEQRRQLLFFHINHPENFDQE